MPLPGLQMRLNHRLYSVNTFRPLSVDSIELNVRLPLHWPWRARSLGHNHTFLQMNTQPPSAGTERKSRKKQRRGWLQLSLLKAWNGGYMMPRNARLYVNRTVEQPSQQWQHKHTHWWSHSHARSVLPDISQLTWAARHCYSLKYHKSECVSFYCCPCAVSSLCQQCSCLKASVNQNRFEGPFQKNRCS